MAYKQYSDAETAEAMVRLAVNKYDYEKTSQDTGVPVRTLKRWSSMTPKKGVPDLLERAIQRMLMVIPDKWDGNSWAIALGILMDKWLLMNNKATSRTETIARRFSELSENELDDVLAEANRILEEAAGGGANQSPGEEI